MAGVHKVELWNPEFSFVSTSSFTFSENHERLQTVREKVHEPLSSQNRHVQKSLRPIFFFSIINGWNLRYQVQTWMYSQRLNPCIINAFSPLYIWLLLIYGSFFPFIARQCFLPTVKTGKYEHTELTQNNIFPKSRYFCASEKVPDRWFSVSALRKSKS